MRSSRTGGWLATSVCLQCQIPGRRISQRMSSQVDAAGGRYPLTPRISSRVDQSPSATASARNIPMFWYVQVVLSLWRRSGCDLVHFTCRGRVLSIAAIDITNEEMREYRMRSALLLRLNGSVGVECCARGEFS